MRKALSVLVIAAFITTNILQVHAGEVVTLFMPKPGTMVGLSSAFTPAHLKGIVIDSKNPFKFDFIIDRGDGQLTREQKQTEYKKLVKYFLASLAVPDENQWVNLSPYEKDRIIKDDFGKTEMGRDLLSQDYLLKQLTASLIYPENSLGKEFWNRVYAKIYEEYPDSRFTPSGMFNKVWIMPDNATVYEHNNTAYVLKNHLKVMLEEDYLALSRQGLKLEAEGSKQKLNPLNFELRTLSSKIVREIILPAIEHEINEGKNFAMLRQVYSGMILAAWYKRALKESLLGKIYANKNKISGLSFPNVSIGNPQYIYQQYLQAFKKGAFNYIKEDNDRLTGQLIPRKYFSGGAVGFTSLAMVTDPAIGNKAMRAEVSRLDAAMVNLVPQKPRLNINSFLDQEKYFIALRGSDPKEIAMAKDHLDRTYGSLIRKKSIVFYHLAKFISEKWAGVKFDWDIDEMINESYAATFEFFKTSHDRKIIRPRISFVISRHLTRLFMLRLGFDGDFTKAIKAFQALSSVIDLPDESYTDKYVLSETVILAEFKKRYPDLMPIMADIVYALRLTRPLPLSLDEVDYPITGDFDYPASLLRDQFRKGLYKLWGQLSPKEERIIRQRLGIQGLNEIEELTLEEIGSKFMTPEGVRQIEFRGLRKFKSTPERKRKLGFIFPLVTRFATVSKGNPDYQLSDFKKHYLPKNILDDLKKKGFSADDNGSQEYPLQILNKLLRSYNFKIWLMKNIGLFDGKARPFVGSKLLYTKKVRDILDIAYPEMTLKRRFKQMVTRVDYNAAPRGNIYYEDLGRAFEEAPSMQIFREIMEQQGRLLKGNGLEEADFVPEPLPIRSKRKALLSVTQEKRLLGLLALKGSMGANQWRILPLVLRGKSLVYILQKNNSVLTPEARRKVIDKLRFIFSLGVLDEFGTMQEVRADLIRLAEETPLQRLMRHTGINDLVVFSQGDIHSLVELIEGLYPDLYDQEDIRKTLENELKQNGFTYARKPDYLPKALQGIHRVYRATHAHSARQRAIIKTWIRDRFYQVMADDSQQGLTVLQEEMDKSTKDVTWQRILKDVYDFYRQATVFEPRGFKDVDGKQPLSPAQRFGIWESAQTLADPKYKSSIHMSEARIGKTIMAILAAYNTRNPDNNEYAVKNVLYTTTNQAKYEVAEELRARTDLDLHIIVVDSEQGDRQEQIAQAVALGNDKSKNVVLIANYESVRDFPADVALFKPDAHIIDEVENLRRGENTLRAPMIFAVRAEYRIGISARPVINKADDVAELLLWARHYTYAPNQQGTEVQQARRGLKSAHAEDLFDALNVIKVRWRRAVVMPNVKAPQEEIEYVTYSPVEESRILEIRDSPQHIFKRYQLERQAGAHLGLLKSPKLKDQDEFSKLKRLDAIIDAELKQNGKVFVLADFVPAIDMVMERYNQKYGTGTAVGLSAHVTMKDRNDSIKSFRGQATPKILIGTSALLGSSLNLYQLPGVNFHISLLVRLTQPWIPFDDAARLVGYGQDRQVRAITLVGKFSERILKSKPGIRSVEEDILILLKNKRNAFKFVVDGPPISDAEALQKFGEIAFADGNKDNAMKGGIDMNSANLAMTIKMEGNEMPLILAKLDLAQLSRIEGFDPIILEIKPAVSLSIFNGLDSK